jgi:carboxymethylenebutenolidase
MVASLLDANHQIRAIGGPVYDALQAETITIAGYNGDQIKAYFARPLGSGPYPGVVVIHHAPGWDEWSTEVTRKFAAHGYLTICPHLYHRAGDDLSPDDAAAATRAKGGISDEQFLGDAAGAVDFLRGLENSNRKVGTIGYCSGGRQSFLAACSLQLDAAVDCYGACVVNPPPPNIPITLTPCVNLTDRLSCPLLGLFGEDDKMPAPAETAELAKVLEKYGKTYQFHTYPGAGHAFFATNRPSYRVEAANDGWSRVFQWFGQYLAA